MRFGDIQAAYFLWIVLVVGVFYFWSFKRRKKAMEDFAQKELLNEIAGSLDVSKQKFKALLIILALFFSIIALSRPKWGFHWEEVHRQGIDILIAIDTSKSMLAEDVKPNRLERSKLAVKDLVKKLKGDRIGLIAFSGTAFLQCPLTVDYNGFILSLDSLSVDTVPKGGTSISSAIAEAIKTLRKEPEKYRILVIITDGEDHEGNPIRAAEAAKKADIQIFCI
ncbi:VWA domain-containing protein, partial [Candidatus Omnitrophota bacterium]